MFRAISVPLNYFGDLVCTGVPLQHVCQGCGCDARIHAEGRRASQREENVRVDKVKDQAGQEQGREDGHKV